MEQFVLWLIQAEYYTYKNKTCGNVNQNRVIVINLLNKINSQCLFDVKEQKTTRVYDA
jgi:hypothetical protein